MNKKSCILLAGMIQVFGVFAVDLLDLRNSWKPYKFEEILDLSSKGLHKIKLENQKNLKHLNLSHNHIEILKSKQFQETPCLEILDLSYNKIHLINGRNFEGLKSIRFLDLSRNRIKHLPAFVFDPFERNWIINLQYNRIIGFPRTVFKKFGVGSEVLLAGNRCVNQDFNEDFFRSSLNHFKDFDDAVRVCHLNYLTVSLSVWFVWNFPTPYPHPWWTCYRSKI